MSVETLHLEKREMFDNPLSFKGRARRSEYIASFFVYLFVIPLLAFKGFKVSDSEKASLISKLAIIGLISPILCLSTYISFIPSIIAYVLVFIGILGAIFDGIVSYWFLFTQGAKRCHDLGHSGWFQLIPFYFIVMLICDGEKEENTYGFYPKTVVLA